jgi:hypothetical protein
MHASPKVGNKDGPIMPIRTLAEAISTYGREAYLLTVAKDGPHTSNVTIELGGGRISSTWVRPPPRTSRANPTCRCSGRLQSPAAMP